MNEAEKKADEIYNDVFVIIKWFSKRIAKKICLYHVNGIIETFIDIDPKLKFWQEVKTIIENK